MRRDLVIAAVVGGLAVVAATHDASAQTVRSRAPGPPPRDGQPHRAALPAGIHLQILTPLSR